MNIIEYDDAYSFVLDGYHYNSRNCQEFTIEIEEGLEATFYKKNARNSKKADIWKLGELAFYKDTWNEYDVSAFWSDFDVRYIPASLQNKKYPPFECLLGSSGGLIKGGYIAVLYRNVSKKHGATLAEQLKLMEEREPGSDEEGHFLRDRYGAWQDDEYDEYDKK